MVFSSGFGCLLWLIWCFVALARFGVCCLLFVVCLFACWLVFVVSLQCLGLGADGALVVSGLRGVWFAVWLLCLASVGFGFGFWCCAVAAWFEFLRCRFRFLGFGGWFVWGFGRGGWFWYMCFVRLVGLREPLGGFWLVTLTVGFGAGYGVPGGLGWCRGWFRLACGRGLGVCGFAAAWVCCLVGGLVSVSLLLCSGFRYVGCGF